MNTAISQVFNRVENIVGLETLRDNNGVAVADYDGDNDLDIFVVAKSKDNQNSANTLSRLYRNDNDGSFTDVTVESGITNLFSQQEGLEDFIGVDGFKYGASWGDFDNDGFPDLFLTFSQKFQLWKNQGDGTFLNVTVAAGFPEFNDCSNTGATWFDYDNDGFLDIYILDWRRCSSNSLYKNNGDGTFDNLTVSADITGAGTLPSYVGFPFDFNEDDYIDLYATTDLELPNELFINNADGTFNESANQYGLATQGHDMGISIGDFNSDGRFDFFITAIDLNFLLANSGEGSFTDHSTLYGVNDTNWSWGNCFSDFDLDGDEDLFVANGYAEENTGNGPEYNFYFENKILSTEESFIDKSEELGLNELSISVEALDFDYDNDGDIDLLVTNSDGGCFFYENILLDVNNPLDSKKWLQIKLEGTVSNRDAIGTTIKVTTENRVLARYYSGVGFLSQSLKPLHFGLNEDNQILNIEINWPSGLTENYSDLIPNSFLKFTEDQGLEVLSIEASQKIKGCTDPSSCNYNPDATTDDNSCTYITSNTITGNTESSFLQTETYQYTIGANSTAQWTVNGGEILTGQGTSSLTVKWHIESVGIITVKEIGLGCTSLIEELEVILGTSNLSENISVARLWNEALLEAIRGDFARPTVHARNLFHSSVAMYDIWAIYDEVARPYLIGNSVQGFTSDLNAFVPSETNEASQKKAISYAIYRLLSHRFQNSPSANTTLGRFQLIMEKLGYDLNNASLDYITGDAAAFGNYVGQTLIDYGLQDGSREATGYDNAFYEPVNTAYALDANQNSPIIDPNRWQPLGLETFIDQSGNIVGDNIPDFLSPEWGNVSAFALKEEDKTTLNRNGNIFNVFHNPENPPFISTTESNSMSDAYKWGFTMVSVWQSHLDPLDGVMWDISPNVLGNIDFETFPTSYNNYDNFYNYIDGGSTFNGHNVNPITGVAYEPNIVPRGDYTRVLAEFWADGPDSETPPGHWFTILNAVNDHPLFEKRFQGNGEILDNLEWDVKSYFILGGGMHDAAIAAWSVKGWYDYIRPISAIRAMAEIGQSSDATLDNYHVGGITLLDNYIEIVEQNDPLVGINNEHIGKIKLYTWKGHDAIEDVTTDQAGVGWILAEDWYPYQRPTFVTPPFAGYVSGHSTFSRAAADLLTSITGSHFFPGGMGEFTAKANEFLVFERGPSVDVKLQWATYQDASDQTSLSRIWGGIHPPADDLPGRLIGQKVAVDTFDFAVPYFETALSTEDNTKPTVVYPNPTAGKIYLYNINSKADVVVYDLSGRRIDFSKHSTDETSNSISLHINAADGIYFINAGGKIHKIILKNKY